MLSSSLGTSTGMLGEWLRFFILRRRKCTSFHATSFESKKRERFGGCQSFLYEQRREKFDEGFSSRGRVKLNNLQQKNADVRSFTNVVFVRKS
mmetsp:Transcript_14179/g.29574  ORF Transcript_14179/g.29574 Transcript_14179/m.29574 type:complete len:93 (-) Transcript_14179:7-285(-)